MPLHDINNLFKLITRAYKVPSDLTSNYLFHPQELTSFNSTDLLFLQVSLEVFALTFPWDCMSGWIQISNLNPKCHFLPEAFC